MDGVFAFLKPPGITSHDAVGICRRLLHEKRIGHSGTLDPLAYGVLPIFVGRATRLIEYTGHETKTYVAEGQFGFSTDTEDSTGHILTSVTSIDAEPTAQELAHVLSTFIGEQMQRPSKYSAIKINGKRAYELARAGEEFVLPERPITIYDCRLLAYKYPFFTIRVHCSSGTYIRALIRDIANAVGIPATMTQLARTQVGTMRIADAVTAEELAVSGEALLQPVDTALQHMPAVRLSEKERLGLLQGKQLRLPLMAADEVVSGQLYRAYGERGFMGIAKGIDGALKAEKNIFLE